jgi:hypothetical protein
MKKTLGVLVLIAGLIALASTSAFAYPVIDGAIGAHPALGAGQEWANQNDPNATAYPFYLEILDPTGDAVNSNVDISRVILLQELASCTTPASCGAFSSGAAPAQDGLYLLIETVGTPTVSPIPGGPYDTVNPQIKLSGDLLGDGLDNPLDMYNIFIRHGLFDHDANSLTPKVEQVRVCVGNIFTCSSDTDFTTTLLGIGGQWSRNSVLEYYIPSGTLGTPLNTQFPPSFYGEITYDNGLANQVIGDDFASGTLPVIPEPSTALMFGVAMLGLAGLKKRFS